MPNEYFKFKQFTIRQDRCAMKVGTDGVLLGAWAVVSCAQHILDIGTGTGLIALMLAQRSRARVDAIEIDHDAALQAEENVRNSHWGDRIRIFRTSFQEYYKTDNTYDLIVSNPPYFTNSLQAPEKRRSLARHNEMLDPELLIGGVCELLEPEGSFSLILPFKGFPYFVNLAEQYHLFISRQTNVFGKPDGPCIRILAEFTRNPVSRNNTDLIIESGGRHQYSSRFIELTKEYYLNH